MDKTAVHHTPWPLDKNGLAKRWTDLPCITPHVLDKNSAAKNGYEISSLNDAQTRGTEFPCITSSTLDEKPVHHLNQP